MTEATVLDPEVIPPDVTRKAETQALAQRYSSEADADLALARDVLVEDDPSYVKAGELRLWIDERRKRAEANEELVCKPLWDHWKFLKGLFRPAIEKRVEACNVLSKERLAYDKKKQAEADRIRREQEEAARKEQTRLDKLAEEKAKRAEAKGDTERAEEIRQTVPQVPLPIRVVGPILPKVAGIAKQQYWFAEVTDLPALVTAAAAGEVPMEAIVANDAWLKKTASALKAAMKYPGVRVWPEWREKGTGR